MNLKITRPLYVFDTETTGPNASQDRIVEIGFIELTLGESRIHTREWSTYVNPTIPIPAAATYGDGALYPGHGITDEMVKDAPTFAKLAPHLLRGFHDCDYAGYNVKSFDVPLLEEEFKRAGHKWNHDGAALIDGFRAWQLLQPRSLSDAAEYWLKRKHEGAHRVLDDVRTSLAVILEQLNDPRAPREPALLHTWLWPQTIGALDPEGKFVWKDDEVICNFGKKFKGVPLKMVSRDYLQWIATKADQMNDRAREIAADALKGKFPVKEEASGGT